MHRTRAARNLIAAILTLWSVNQSIAQVELSRLFDSHMVIQRGKEVPVWGKAEPNAEVTVTFGGETILTTATPEGRWRAVFEPRSGGGPFELIVSSGNDRRLLKDVWVGDVWLCSGQSNMEWPVAASDNADAEIASANDSHIRHFDIPRSWAWVPQDTLTGGSWEVATPETVGDFTAVGYYFARELRKHVDVPIGLINSTWGGSRIEPWMSSDALGMSPEETDVLRQAHEERRRTIEARLGERVGGLPDSDRGFRNGEPIWSIPELDDADWDTVTVPGHWEENGYAGLDGVGWYRTDFNLSEAQASRDLSLSLGMIADTDDTWVNGIHVGGMEWSWNTRRDYLVPSDVLRPGRNSVAVRVEDYGYGGGIHGADSLIYIESGGIQEPLAGDWRFRVGKVELNFDGMMNQVPTVLYNQMIHPFLDFPVTGVIWYQGESNATPDDAFAYRHLFKDMINQWRADRDDAELPFLFVQLANYMGAQAEPGLSDWAVLRESQHEALDLANTAEAVTIDIGESADIHPKNKQDVGLRLALAARRLVYGEDLLYSGPVLSGHEIRDGRVYLSFDHTGAGLQLRALSPDHSGFAVAGRDGRFFWAQAAIEHGRVVVWNENIPDPVAVRYAWADNPEGANLYNSAGLPASPFRTDKDDTFITGDDHE